MKIVQLDRTRISSDEELRKELLAIFKRCPERTELEFDWAIGNTDLVIFNRGFHEAEGGFSLIIDREYVESGNMVAWLIGRDRDGGQLFEDIVDLRDWTGNWDIVK